MKSSQRQESDETTDGKYKVCLVYMKTVFNIEFKARVYVKCF